MAKKVKKQVEKDAVNRSTLMISNMAVRAATDPIVLDSAKKVTFRDRYNSKRKKTLVEGFSMTIPNQSMTVKEIYNRYVVGAPLPNMSQRDFTSDPEELWDVVPDFDKMDLADIAEFSRNLAGKSAYLRKKLEERHKKESQRAETKDEVPSSSDSAQQ